MANRLKRLDKVVTLQRGFDLPSNARKWGDVPIVASTGVNGWHNEAKVKGPGVVIGRSGSIGGGQYIQRDFWPLNTTLWAKDFQGNLPRYVYYLLKSIDFSGFNAGAGVPTLNRNHIASLLVVDHEIEQQKSINDILSAYDDLIENNRRRIGLLEDAARQLYKEWFVRFRFPGHDHVKIIGGVPEGWEVVTYHDVFEFLGGFAFKSSTYVDDGKYGIVTIKNVHDGRFVPDCSSRVADIPQKMNSHCELKTGDILLSLTGNVGRACVVYGEGLLLNQRVAKIVGRTGIPDSFTYWTFSNPETQRELENLAFGVAQLNLSPVKLAARRFVRPPRPLLEGFADFADGLYNQIIKLNQSVAELAKARDLLLPRLMNGSLTV